MRIIEKDVLIIGSGLAGLYTSLNLKADLAVGIVSKDQVHQSNSVLAQGGIASCMTTTDSVSSHIEDTLNAGSYVNNVDAVELLVKNAPKEIHQLIELGVEFDKDEKGMILTTLEGGHSHRRVLHANGDATGKVIMEHVTHKVAQRKNIEVIEKAMALSVVRNAKGKIAGVVLLHQEAHVFIKTHVVVIATGGIGGLFKETTNHSFSTGDGIAIAKVLGCQLVDMCFVQFHPTALYREDTSKRFLITEAVRGEGGKLRNEKLDTFMEQYDSRGDLAPRDIVSQSVFHEMNQSASRHVWLDIREKDRQYLEKRFPTVYHELEELNIQMEKDLIPVAPVAHYFVGGIATDLHGRTTVPGVYACGEVSSTGVHGANRLASNSLLECVVFGKRTAIHINQTIHREVGGVITQEALTQDILDQEIQERDTLDREAIAQIRRLSELPSCSKTGCDYIEEKSSIRNLMTEYVGIVRTNEGLLTAQHELQEKLNRLLREPVLCYGFFETVNMCEVGLSVIEDGLEKDSIGCHVKVKEKEQAYVSLN